MSTIEERIRNFDPSLVSFAEDTFNNLEEKNQVMIYNLSAKVIDTRGPCREYNIDYNRGNLAKQLLVTMKNLGYFK